MKREQACRLAGYLLPAAVILLWEVCARAGFIDLDALPAPSAILAEAANPGALAELGGQTLVTLRRILTGFALGGAAGFLLGFACGCLPRLYAALETIIEFLRPMPSVALIPIGILFLGTGDALCEAIVAFACSWPVFISALRGAGAAGAPLVNTARTLGASRARITFRVILPAALPNVFTGLRVGLGVAVAVAVITEMAASGSGLGALILSASLSFRVALMYAAIAAAGLLGFTLNALFTLTEDRLLAWRHGASKEAR